MRDFVHGCRGVAPGAGIAAIAALLAGCGGASLHSGPAVTTRDFGPTAAVISQGASPKATAQTQAPTAEATTSAAPSGRAVTGPLAASEGIVNVTTTAAAPATLPKGPMPDAAGPAVLVDAKIGDVNGHAIYATKFLEPMADRLRAEGVRLAAQYPREDWRPRWREFARDEITRAIQSFIEDELVRAEALAALNPDQKKGFFAFVQGLAGKAESANMGSRSAADITLAPEGGIDQWLKHQEVRLLVEIQKHKLEQRVNIGWRAIALEYEKRYAEFHPTPKARFRMVQILDSRPEDIQTFRDELAKGSVPFSELAAKPYNLYKPEVGGLDEIQFTGPDIGSSTFYGIAVLNDAARSLQPGQTAGPFAQELGKGRPTSAWLHLDEVVSKPMSLYDAQIPLEYYLRGKRLNEEASKFLSRLRSKASVTSDAVMTDRLMTIAEDRFLPRKGR